MSFPRLYQDFLKTCSKLSQDLLGIFMGFSQDFLGSFSRLPPNFLKSFKDFPIIVSGHSEVGTNALALFLFFLNQFIKKGMILSHLKKGKFLLINVSLTDLV